MRAIVVFAAGALLAGAAFVGQQAAAESAKPGVKAGVLKCDVAAGWGLVFGSSKDLRCVFTPSVGDSVERYGGSIDKYGVDLGYSQSGVILWAVFAPTDKLEKGALEGTYIGATAEVTAGLGLGANVLLGGNKSVALQPLSISGQQGLNVAGGIAAVTLTAGN